MLLKRLLEPIESGFRLTCRGGGESAVIGVDGFSGLTAEAGQRPSIGLPLVKERTGLSDVGF